MIIVIKEKAYCIYYSKEGGKKGLNQLFFCGGRKPPNFAHIKHCSYQLS